MADIPGLTAAMVVKLGENGIKDRDDLAELAGDELSGSEAEGEPGILAEFKLSEPDANAIITAARAHWFAEEDAARAAAEAAAAAEAEAEAGAEAEPSKEA